jgi:excinuclease ABC subunit C
MQSSLNFPEEICYLPSSPGVYIMKDGKGKVIYVGKAKSLKKRVISYTRPKDPKTAALSRNIRTVDFIVSVSEEEALLLENNLIKKHFPMFNVRLVDDENYPYIKISDEKYPKILKVYRIRGEKGDYFGPFPHGSAVEQTIKGIRKIFPIRSCNIKIRDDRDLSPCLLFHLRLCTAPCAHKISQKEYMKMVESLKLFLKGENKIIVNSLQRDMEKAKNDLDFEKAILYRDEFKSITSIMEKQRVVSNENISFDAFAAAIQNPYACVVRVSVRDGRVVSTYPFIIDFYENIDIGGLIERFLFLYPLHAQGRKIYVEKISKNRRLLEKILSEKSKHSVRILTARGPRLKNVMSLAKENAEEHLKNYISRHIELKEKKLLESLREKLALNSIPIRIEGYDISNVSGVDSVGSMVVFTNGKPDKKEYRHFRIKFTKGPNDFGMLEEVLTRRFSETEDFASSLPNLLLIDGGKGQLDVALKIKKFYEIDVDVISLAKKEEIVYGENRKEAIKFGEDSEELKLLQRIRDESHRFAKSYFTKLHGKRYIGGNKR